MSASRRRAEAEALLGRGDAHGRATAYALLRELVGDPGTDPLELPAAHYLLARICEQQGDDAEAAEAYRASIAAQQHSPERYGAELALAELLARRPEREADGEALDLLDDALHAGLISDADRYRWSAAHARLAERAGRTDGAAAFALGALRMLTLGAASATPAAHEELLTLAAAGDPERFAGAAAVERRDHEGQIAWDWPLLELLSSRVI